VEPKLYIGLDPRPGGFVAATIEPGFGHLIETFNADWDAAARVIGQSLQSWLPYYSLSEITVALCPDDALWPQGFCRHLQAICTLHVLRRQKAESVLALTARLLRRPLDDQRAELLAFLARHATIVGCDSNPMDLAEADLACAWGLLLSRQQLLEVELTITCGGYSDGSYHSRFDPLTVVAETGPMDKTLMPF